MDHSILVVEDDEILADNICTYLKLKGFEVTVCHSAELALEQIKRAQPDAVLTDNSLPGMSGHDLLRTLVAQAPELKVIMMTGYGNVEDAVLAMKEGAFHYLTKPVVLAELKLMLDKALATERMERTLSFYQEREAQKSGLQALIGESPVMLELKHTLRQVLDAERRMASDDLPPVLVEGETGTGKELVARPAFRRQPRQGAFHRVQLRVDPGQPAGSRTVWPRKGAFTDAKERRGPGRGGRWRHPVPRRDRRDGPGAAGQAAQAAGRSQHSPHWCGEGAQGRFAGDQRHQLQP
jgi:DNA-binding NtrC family response regulator